MKTRIFTNKLFLILFLLIPVTGLSQVTLPKLIADGMVLQRDTDVKIWGWASAYEQISVHFRDMTYRSAADSAGEWEIVLSDLKAGGPYEMIIEAGNRITLQDILIGDVWVVSGQSNMELPMRRVRSLYEEEIATGQNDYIRYFNVPQKYDFNTPQKDLDSGHWQKTDPETVREFSAAAYFFAKELYETYHIPIGLINTSLGGSPAEAWMSEEALKEFPVHYQEAQRFKDSDLINQIESADRARINAWYAELNRIDKGYQDTLRWDDPSLDISDWSGMNIPGFWADTDLGAVNGVVWFKKEISIPEDEADQPAELNLGAIVDADSVFVNGRFVGTTSYQYPPRSYSIPAGILKKGKNTIAIRVINERGRGGFVPDKPYGLVVGNHTIDLKGRWCYRLGAVMEPLESQTFIRWKPLGLYNAMISPLLNYSIKGVIWYQGESNADRPVEYRRLFPAMIQDWRHNWNRGDFPFLFVQLANFMEAKDQPSESNWAMLREAQHRALSVSNTGMAVTIDIGEWNDIHPLNKKDVGKRLALGARKIAYGEDIVFSGPEYQSMHIDGNKIILNFTNTGSGLMVNGEELNQFAIAGPDSQFVWAHARIEDDKVIVWNDDVPDPIAVRYAWADNPEGANLYNKEGLPAIPFRTDDFPIRLWENKRLSNE
jgi:sialate O-acetylesterase